MNENQNFVDITSAWGASITISVFLIIMFMIELTSLLGVPFPFKSSLLTAYLGMLAYVVQFFWVWFLTFMVPKNQMIHGIVLSLFVTCWLVFSYTGIYDTTYDFAHLANLGVWFFWLSWLFQIWKKRPGAHIPDR